jgi:hypothetical protein
MTKESEARFLEGELLRAADSGFGIRTSFDIRTSTFVIPDRESLKHYTLTER